jgi:hypothetical protein
MGIQLGCCSKNLKPLSWELHGNWCLHPFKIVLLGVVVLLYSMHECTVDVGKISMRYSIWVLFIKFETIVLGTPRKSSGWEYCIFPV